MGGVTLIEFTGVSDLLLTVHPGEGGFICIYFNIVQHCSEPPFVDLSLDVVSLVGLYVSVFVIFLGSLFRS